MSKVVEENKVTGIAHPRQFRPWTTIAVGASILMELSISVIWYRVAISFWEQVSYAKAFVVFGMIFLVSYFLTLVLGLFDFKIKIQRIVMFILLVISMVVVLKTLLYSTLDFSLSELFDHLVNSFFDSTSFIPAEFVLLLIILVIIWRGASLAGRQVDPGRFLDSFRIGIFLMFAFGISFGQTEHTPVVILYAFLFFGLLGLTSARISTQVRLRGGLNIRFTKRWLIGITVVILIILSISFVIASLLSEYTINLEIDIFGWLLFLLTIAISPFVWIALFIISYLDQWIQFERILRSLSELFNIIRSVVESFLSIFEGITRTLDFRIFSVLYEYLIAIKPFILWGVLVVIGVLILMFLVRKIKEENIDEEKEYQDDIDQENLLGLLREALRNRFKMIAENLEQVLNLDRARRSLMAARIRRIYANLLDMSARLGIDRPLSYTPLEFLPHLEVLFPSSVKELDLITQAYLRVRYGELPETKGEVEIVEIAWKRVKTLGQEKLRTKKRSFELKR